MVKLRLQTLNNSHDLLQWATLFYKRSEQLPIQKEDSNWYVYMTREGFYQRLMADYSVELG